MHKKVILQIVFWVSIFIINLALLPFHMHAAGQLVYEIFCVLFYAFLFYLNILFLFPRYYESKKVNYYLISIFLMLFGLFFLNLFNLTGGGPHDHHHVEKIVMIVVFKQLLWMVLVFLTGTIYSIQDRLNQQIIRHKQVMEEKLQTELQLLKAQINPHFLFNALNNIYSLTYMQSEKAPESVLKLSEMLRYVIEDCSSENVPLKKEIAYINSFIDFYKMKNPGERDILFSTEIENPEVRIAPMLLIPFVENSFKYCRIEEDKEGFIHLNLIEKDGKLTFSIKNTIFKARVLLPGSGKGIPNVKQRLEIIYPGRHQLYIAPGENEFLIGLTIDLS